MKKLSLILIAVAILLTGSCNTWMQDDNFYADIENDVKVANAKQISVYVRYALTKQGQTNPDGPATFKVEIPTEISATTEPEYGFVRWAAFSTDFLATGDNQTKNKDIYFIDDDDYNERILPHEIQSPIVVFEDATKPTTGVKINEERNDIFLCPIVAQRPAVALTIPARGASQVVRNMAVRINFTKPMDVASFKNESGEFDKITITQGTQGLSSEGDIEIYSNDITSRFEEPVFSKNQKMVTLQFKSSELALGYTSNSLISVTISKEVKDIFGFTMTEDEIVSFSVGSDMDNLAPRIEELTAGRTLQDFHKFKGMYKDAGSLQAAGTQMYNWPSYASGLGAKDAPASIDAANGFYNTFAPTESSSEEGYRVKDSLYIRVYARDIAGPAQTGLEITNRLQESDVAIIGVKSSLLFDANGTASTYTGSAQSFTYMAQSVAPGISGSYSTLINNLNDSVSQPTADGNEDMNANNGFLFKYNFADTDPDGLYRLDVYAIDIVQNDGSTTANTLSAAYGNGYASLFIVKDSTPPDASANASKISLDTSHATPSYYYFNNISTSNYYRNYLKLNGEPSFVSSTASIVDSGHERLRSKHSSLKWNVKLSENTATGWHSITSDLTGFPEPPAQGQINFTYSLQDDLGNVSSEVTITPTQPVKYDSVAPAVQNPSFQLANTTSGEVPGSAKSNILANQKLVIPLTEATSGITKLEIQVRKASATEDYGSPFGAASASTFSITSGGSAIAGSAPGGGKVYNFTTPQTFNAGTIEITGLKISDATSGTDLEGSYTVKVKVTDAADNEYTTTSGAAISIDNTAPAVSRVYIPNLKKAVRASSPSTIEYWADYALLDRSGTYPVTDVYVVFNEADSGAKVFDFTTSTLKLTNASQVYVAEPGSLSASTTAIPSSVDTTNNILTITSANDAVKNAAGATSAAVKITNVQLASAPSASNIAIKVRDTATNVTATAHTTIDSAEGTLNLTGITSFKYENTDYYPYSEILELKDNVTEASCIEAESGYTNNEYVNARVKLWPSNSGIYKLTLSGNAVFSTDAAHPTKFTLNGDLWDETPMASSGTSTVSNFLQFDLSDDRKTVIFKNGTDHAVIGDQASSGSHRGSSFYLYIKDLKLTDNTTDPITDGPKAVTIKAESFYGYANPADSASANYTIKLDTHVPQWVDQNVGTANEKPGRLYAAYYDSDSSDSSRIDRIYPHPVPTSTENPAYAYGINIPENGNPILYFYHNFDSYSPATSSLDIYPKYTENNPKDDVCKFVYQGSNSNPVEANYYSYNYNNAPSTVTWTAQLRDKAGNLSTIQTYKVVRDSTFADSTALGNIQHYFTIEAPANAKFFRSQSHNINTFTTSQSSNYHVSGSLPNSPKNLKVYNYVIKGNPDTSVTNTGYKIKLKLTTGLSSTDTLLNEENPASNDPRLNTKCALMDATTDYTPIEYYAISHWYSSYPSIVPNDENNFLPAFPNTNMGFNSTGSTVYGTDKTSWHKYTTTTSYNTDTDVDSRIDEDGNLEILLPNNNTPPLAVLLKDGCGNFNYVLVKPVADAYSDDMYWNHNMPAWIPDSSVGTHYKYYSSASQISNPRPGNSNGVNFYRNGAQYSFYDCYDTCTYTSSVVANSSNYTLKSRVIAWTGSTAPSQSDFNFTTPTTIAPAASDWNYKTSTGGSITMAHELPHYIATSPYKLYSIIEDRVGNCEIYQLKENTSSPVTDNWFYDNTVPTTTVSTAVKVNTVNDGTPDAPVMKNYYSSQSTVIYDITDNESGIKSTASETFSFTSFNARETSKTGISYPLGNYTPGTGGAMSISGVENWAGGQAASASLTYNGSGVWVKQTIPTPALTSTSVTAVNATDWYKDRSRYDITISRADQTTPITDENPHGGGQYVLTITSKAVNTDIDLKLPATSSSDSIRLLGWVVSDSPLTTFADFYYPSNSTDTNATAANKVSEDVNYEAGAFIYHYNKPNGTLSYNAWYGNVADKYFYPVNRAGLIRKQPVKVTFAQNQVPSLKNNAVTSYSGNNSSGNETIHAYGTGNNRVNYTKTGASVTFTTENNPSTCWIIYGKGTDNRWGTSDDDHKEFTLNSYLDSSVAEGDENYPQYTIPLDDDDLKLSDKEFYLMLSTTSEDSSPYSLKGPADYNKWTFDETAPTVSFGASDIKTVIPPDPAIPGSTETEENAATYTVGSGSSAVTTRYIQSEKARINLTLSPAPTSTTPTDIDKYQWKVGAFDWADINTTDASTLPYLALPAATAADPSTGVITFNAPAEKTNYQFRVIDKAGNISTSSTVNIQRDDTPPSGTIDFDILDGSGNSVKTTLKNNANQYLVELTPDGSNAANATGVTIYYSSRSANTSSYIKTLKFNFTGITDVVDSVERSGIQNYQISTDGGSNWTTYTSGTGTGAMPSNKIISYTLTDDTSGTTVYKFKFKDNINQESEVLKTITMIAYGSNPTLTPTEHAVQTKENSTATATDAASKVVSSTQTNYYFKEGTLGVLNFTISDAANTTYQYTANANAANPTWAPIPDITGNSLAFTVNANDLSADPAAYRIRAIDKVGNITPSYIYYLAKDADAPTGTFDATKYKFKVSESGAYTGSDYFTDTPTTESETTYQLLRYNTSQASHIEFNFDEITDADSGIAAYIWNYGTNDTVWDAPITSKTIAIPTTDAVYTLSVKDKVGHVRLLKKFKFVADSSTPDLPAPTVASRTGETIDYNPTADSSSIYWIKGDNALITLSATDAGGDLAAYEWRLSTAETWTSQEISTTTVSIAATEFESLAKTYQFRAKDTVGHISTPVREITLQKDTTAPDGSLTSYTPQLLGAATAATGFYLTPTEDSTTTPSTIEIKYNPNKVGSLAIDASGVADETGGSGLAGIFYRLGETDTQITSGAITGLNSLTTATTYAIVAKDLAGNEKVIQNFRLIPHGTAPSVGATNNPPYSGLQWPPTYPYQTNNNSVLESPYRIKGVVVSGDTYSLTPAPSSITEATVNIWTYDDSTHIRKNNKENANSYGILQFGDTATFTLPVAVSSLPSTKLYYAFTYNSSVEPTTWTEVADVSAGKIENVSLDLTKVTKRHTFIFIWYKDEIGNIGVYNVINPGTTNANWWTTEASKGTSGNVSDFNDFTYGTPPAGGGGSYFGNGDSGIPSVLSGLNSKGSERKDRSSAKDGSKSGFFERISNIFVHDVEPASEALSSDSGKSDKKSKKAAKAAKKAAKAAKKKTTKSTSAAAAPTSAVVEALETTSQTAPVTAALATTSTAAASIAPTSAVIEDLETTSQTSPVVEPVETTSSSKSAVIVVMLAALSGLAGTLYTLKRKKK